MQQRNRNGSVASAEIPPIFWAEFSFVKDIANETRAWYNVKSDIFHGILAFVAESRHATYNHFSAL